MKTTILTLFCCLVFAPIEAAEQAYVKIGSSFPLQGALEMYSLHSTRVVIVSPGVWAPSIALTHLEPMTSSQTIKFIEDTLLRDHQMTLTKIGNDFALLSWSQVVKPASLTQTVPAPFDRGTLVKSKSIKVTITDSNGQEWTVGDK